MCSTCEREGNGEVCVCEKGMEWEGGWRVGGGGGDKGEGVSREY